MKKTAVVTGAASGIGKATAKAFLQAGYGVVLVDLRRDALKAAAAELPAAEGDIHWVDIDISDAAEVQRLSALLRELDCPVAALANCAGVFRGGIVHEAAEEDFDFQFGVNVKGTFLMMREVIPFMLEKGGAIVNVASASGMRGDYNAPLYCASKAAVINLSRACALDYTEKGIRVNCVSPAATATPMFLSGTNEQVMNAFLSALPDHALGLPEQVADAILFLASDRAQHISGQNLPVDGGLTAWNGQPRQDKEADA